MASSGSTGILDFDMIQQLATIHWAATGDSKISLDLAVAKLVGEVWQRLSAQPDMDALRNETIMKICKYVKDNPRASKEQLSKEIGKEIEAFAKKVESL